MVVGHYGPSFAVKAIDKTIPLWLLFVAVQFVDILWATFVLLGIEKVRIVPGITATNPLDLYYMPYTHSLVAVILWSGCIAVAYRYLTQRGTWTQGGLIAAAVFSHWILDLLVHRPDLPLYDDAVKVGLGLWNYPIPAFLLEVVLLFGGMFWYFKATKSVVTGGRYSMILFGFVMFAIQASVFFGPPPPSDKAIALMGLVSYVAFAAVAYRLEQKRI